MVSSPATSAPASDGLVLGLDPGLAYWGGNELGDAGAIGGSIRFGYQFKMRVSVVPELKLTFWHFMPPGTFYPHVDLFQAKVGARLVFGDIVRPTLYAHMGYGHESSERGQPDSFPARGGFGYDVGAGLAIRVVKQFELGPNIEFNRLTNGGMRGDSTSFINIGLLANIYF
jgi:hypothetical protein